MSETSPVEAPYLTAASLARTAAYILDRPRYLTRVIEDASIDGDVLTRRVELQTCTGPGMHLLLIAAPEHAELRDLIRVEASPVTSGFILGREETYVVVSRMILDICGLVGLRDTAAAHALSAIASMPPDHSLALLSTLDELAQVPIRPTNSPPEETEISHFHRLAHVPALVSLLRIFRLRRPLFAVVDPKFQQCSVRFSFENGRREYTSLTPGELARSWLGLSAYDLTFPISEALRSQSYHFRMRAPNNHFIASTAVLASSELRSRWKSADLKSLRDYKPHSPAFRRFSARDADGLVHVQLGDVSLETAPPAALFVRVKISERPLGQMGGALWRWLMVAIVLYTMLRLGRDLVEARSMYGVTVLLAIPAALGVANVATATLGALNVSGAARFASISSGFVALGAAISLLAWHVSFELCVSRDETHLSKGALSHCSADAPGDVARALMTLWWVTMVVVGLCLLRLGAEAVRYRKATATRDLTRS